MHWLVLLLFSPMFIYTDVTYSGVPTAILHGIMSVLLIQSWAPMHAEAWNSPTWYLSSLGECLIFYDSWFSAFAADLLSSSFFALPTCTKISLLTIFKSHHSSLGFGNALLPFSLPKIASMDKEALFRTTGWLLVRKVCPSEEVFCSRDLYVYRSLCLCSVQLSFLPYYLIIV